MNDTKIKVVYIDDDPFLRDMYAIKFTASGIDFKAYAGGKDFFDDLKSGKITPDVVLLDIIMPNMDGLQILETIRNEKLIPDVTIIMLTNQSSPREIDRSRELGVAGYIVKANNIPSEVVEKVKKIHEDFIKSKNK